jgi:hypothetical protein
MDASMMTKGKVPHHGITLLTVPFAFDANVSIPSLGVNPQSVPSVGRGMLMPWYEDEPGLEL